MDLLEHQGKELFERHGIKLIPRAVAETPAEAREAAGRLGPVAVKVQVQAGGRGKGGGIVLAKTPDEAERAARKMFEGGFNGLTVTQVLLERMVDIDRELYMAITLDRGEQRYVAMTSIEGGIDIEEVAATRPQTIRRAAIDPLLGLKPFHVRRLVGGFPEPAREGAGALLERLYEVLIASDATLVEVNPLAVLEDGRVVPLDAKVTIDDNALGRHPDLAEFASAFAVDPTEARARELGLQYVKLDGQVGIIGNGAGLVMATLDVVQQAGGAAANFLDVGGGAGADVMAASLEVILSDPAVRSVLVNIFGGITRGDLVAGGILEALERVEATVPIVVRLDGTNAEEGRKILADAGHPRIVPAATMLEAARLAVEATA
jgi:succinyl-CoA synthetase beta subunit